MIAAQPSISTRLFEFVGGDAGEWIVQRMDCVVGEALAPVSRIAVRGDSMPSPNAAWVLRGITSNERYVQRAEKQMLRGKQQGLGRVEATCAALIPVRKTPAWWALSQDERRDIFEAQSHHIEIGLKYLPAIARRLHHCRDLASNEPFDFLTWFEYAPAEAMAFEALTQALRASPEWAYVDREIDVRMTRAS